MTISKYKNVEELQENSIFSYQNLAVTIDTLEEMKLLLERRRDIAQEGMIAMQYHAAGMQYESELEYLHEEFEKLEELIYQTKQLIFNFYPEYLTDKDKDFIQGKQITFVDSTGGKTGDDAVVGTMSFQKKLRKKHQSYDDYLINLTEQHKESDN